MAAGEGVSAVEMGFFSTNGLTASKSLRSSVRLSVSQRERRACSLSSAARLASIVSRLRRVTSSISAWSLALSLSICCARDACLARRNSSNLSSAWSRRTASCTMSVIGTGPDGFMLRKPVRAAALARRSSVAKPGEEKISSTL